MPAAGKQAEPEMEMGDIGVVYLNCEDLNPEAEQKLDVC